MRRRALLLPLLAATLGGCSASLGSTPGPALTPAQRSARVTLIRAHQSLSDRNLARLCPALYPSDYLTNTKKYPKPKGKEKKVTFTAADRAQATAADCSARS